MARKGKKKKQTEAAAASTSKDEKSQQEKQEQILSQVLPGSSQSMQQKVSKSPEQQQKQKVAETPQLQTSQSKQQSSQQKQYSLPKPQQQKGSSQDQPQQASQSPLQQQQVPQVQPQLQGVWSQRQQQLQSQSQQQQVSQSLQSQGQLPQQVPRGPRQQQPQQQIPQGSWQQQQVPQSHLQQQVLWGPWQQQLQGQMQQQQVPCGPRHQQLQQQVPQGSWRQQQVPQGQLQQQVPCGPRQQLPQQQVPQGPWRQQQVPQGQPQQLQGVWGQRQQQQLQLQEQGPNWDVRQIPQQVLPSQTQQQQQKASTSIQQQQSVNIGVASDQQRQAVGMHQQQPSTSTKSLEVSKLSLTDPFHSNIEKKKMSSDQLVLYQNMIPKRAKPNEGGSVGIKIEVLTNMFKIIFDNKFVTNAVHYDVAIKPYKQSTEENGKKKGTQKELQLPKTLCRSIFEQFRNKHFNNRYPAYDGKKNAYSANDLPFDNDLTDIFEHLNLDGRSNKYQIIVKKVANIDLSWIKNLKPGLAGNREQTAIQVLDIIMRHAPESQFTSIGRSLFWDINENEPLTGGVALARGGFMSGVLGWRPYLNIDVSHKGFTMKQTVLAYIAEVTRVREDSLTYNDVMRFEPKIQSFLRGLKVTYEIPKVLKRTYRVIKLSKETSYSEFINSDNQKLTIKQYFLNSKRYNIKKPELPTLHVSTKADGSEILLPIELCTIMPSQPIRKLNELQTSNMIKKTVTDASIRKKRIEDAFRTIEVNNSPVMTREFHLSVSKEMEKVPARILPAPELKYNRETAQVKKGTWNLKQFTVAKSLENNSWTIINLSGFPSDPYMQDFAKMLQQTANSVGMVIGQACTPFKSFRYNPRNITEYFNDNKKLKLIIVIIPDHTDVIYGNIKKITEMEIGVLTQCMKFRTLKRLSESKQLATVRNILLKINSKLDGINHTFDKMPSCLHPKFPCMLVGADVTHPSPDSRDIPSVAAVAASQDTSAFRYNIALRLQQPKEEMILDLKEIILAQLQIFVNESNQVPKRIIYYRDGVSEGQLPQVMYYEIEAIKKAIYEFTHGGQKGNIEVTCIVVQKRHHIRFFPTNPRDEIDLRTKNVQAGTIVDTTITHPDHIDFYLVSHASIQGTARPTKYRCICNESKFTEDQLEELTYYLCHIYARCTRAVSYPAPTYYAHLGAYRGRALIQGRQDFNLCDLEREQRNFIIKMGKMFFV